MSKKEESHAKAVASIGLCVAGVIVGLVTASPTAASGIIIVGLMILWL